MGARGVVLVLVTVGTALRLPAEAVLERARIETERTVLEYPRGALAEAEAREFATLLDNGVRDVEATVAPFLPETQNRAARVRYVVTDSAPIARTFRRTVVLPLERVRSRSAPYLHETTHVLVPSGNDCAWLNEGLASYLESRVSEERGGYDAHVFSRGGNAGIDAAARRHLARAPGRAMLDWVGACGTPPELDSARERFAPAFYVLSQSFVKYLCEHAGLGPVVQAAQGDVPAPLLAQATGRQLADWKRDWVQALVR